MPAHTMNSQNTHAAHTIKKKYTKYTCSAHHEKKYTCQRKFVCVTRYGRDILTLGYALGYKAQRC
jgi:hypothetical protein